MRHFKAADMHATKWGPVTVVGPKSNVEQTWMCPAVSPVASSRPFHMHLVPSSVRQPALAAI